MLLQQLKASIAVSAILVDISVLIRVIVQAFLDRFSLYSCEMLGRSHTMLHGYPSLVVQQLHEGQLGGCIEGRVVAVVVGLRCDRPVCGGPHSACTKDATCWEIQSGRFAIAA